MEINNITLYSPSIDNIYLSSVETYEILKASQDFFYKLDEDDEFRKKYATNPVEAFQDIFLQLRSVPKEKIARIIDDYQSKMSKLFEHGTQKIVEEGGCVYTEETGMRGPEVDEPE